MLNLNEYLMPHTPEEAQRMMRGRDGVGVYLAGGTDVLLTRRDDLEFIVDLSRTGLDEVEAFDDGTLMIGSCVTLNTLEHSPAAKVYAGGVLARAAGACGNRPIRTTATVGGNLCNALPSADMIPPLLALDATARMLDGENVVETPLADFFLGPRRTVLGDRILLGLVLPARNAELLCASRKLTRTAEDIALVEVATALALDGGRVTRAAVAIGAVAPTARRAPEAEQALVGVALGDDEAVSAAARLAANAADPISDHRAGADYRRAMVEVLARRLIDELLADAQEGNA